MRVWPRVGNPRPPARLNVLWDQTAVKAGGGAAQPPVPAPSDRRSRTAEAVAAAGAPSTGRCRR